MSYLCPGPEILLRFDSAITILRMEVEGQMVSVTGHSSHDGFLKVLTTHAILKAPQSFDAYSCSLNFRWFYGYFRQHNEAKVVLFDSTGRVTKRPHSFSFVILSLVGARSHVRSPATCALPSNSH